MHDLRANQAISSHTALFMAGRFDPMLPRYAEVLPVYMKGKLILVNGHEYLRECLQIHRDKALTQGVTSLVGRVQSRSQVGQRIRFAVEWTYGWSTTPQARTCNAVYFCKKLTDGVMIEMMEFKTLAFPDAPSWYDRTSSAFHPTPPPNPTYLH